MRRHTAVSAHINAFISDKSNDTGQLNHLNILLVALALAALAGFLCF
jgi:hypothetical protein